MNCIFEAGEGVNARGRPIRTCRICRRSIYTHSPPEKLTRPCPGKLNAIGQQLIKLKPGAGLALLIKYSGAKAAAEWAEFIEKDCPECQDREARMERGWQRLVWKFCATMPNAASPPPLSP